MTVTCNEHRSRMFEYVRGDLVALEKTRLEAHLENCGPCAGVRDSIRRGVDSAATWTPEIDPEHFERLTHRLAPYMQEARAKRRSGFVAGFAVAAACAVALIVFAISEQPPQPPKAAPSMIATHVKPEPKPASVSQKSLGVVDVQRVRVAPGVRAVASQSWDGVAKKTDRGRLELRMSEGFAVLDMTRVEGIEGGNVDLVVAALRARASGRVFVEVSPQRLVTIGVISGRASVDALDGTLAIEPGARRTFDLEGRLAAPVTKVLSGAFEGDAFLSTREPQKTVQPPARVEVEQPAPIARKIRKKRRGTRRARARARPELRPTEAGALELIAEAENLALRGRAADAIAKYEAVLDDQRRSLRPYRPLIRYEIARIRAFQLGQVQRARAELTRLARAPGEVGTQSAFALCELEVEEDPCGASQCLRALGTRRGGSVQREALELVDRWGLEKNSCPDHKNAR